MNWADLIKQFRASRGLNQMDLAELCAVRQATVSRWEAGRHIPDLATRNRFRAMLRALDSKSDRAIVQAVRYAHTCAGLTLADSEQVIEASFGGCRLQGAGRADMIKIPLRDRFRHFNRAPMDQPMLKALKSGDVLALHITMEAPIFKTGGKLPVATTLTPLWLSDGTFVLRGDTSVLPPGEYRGPVVTPITGE
jgi:transcriptional regulator with XRE-family HTH domain